MRVILEAQHACTPTPRGIPVYTIELINSLVKRNVFDYSISFFDKNKEKNNRQYIDRYFGSNNVPIYECNTESYADLTKFGDVYKNKSYNDIIGAEGDVVHCMHLLSFPTNFTGKVIVTVHDMLPLMFPEWFNNSVVTNFKFWCDRVLEKEPYIIADSVATKNDIQNITGYKKIFVVHLGYDKNIHYQDKNMELLRNINITSPYIFYCGALDMRKNILRILDAFEKVENEIPDIKLVLAGAPDVNSAEIVKRLEEKKMDSRVIFMGFISNDLKRVLMSNAEIFLFPSTYEGFGLPIIEAMACGCPVITSNISSMPEVAGDAAVLINPYNTDELYTSIMEILTSANLKNKLVASSLKQASKFSWNKTATKVEEIYRKVYTK